MVAVFVCLLSWHCMDINRLHETAAYFFRAEAVIGGNMMVFRASPVDRRHRLSKCMDFNQSHFHF